MKLFSTYIKEMKIASRGFYFYIEIFVAVVALIILLVAVNENPDGKAKEYLHYDMPQEAITMMMEKNVQEGQIRMEEETVLTLKPASFEVTNKETGVMESYDYDTEETVTAVTFSTLEKETGKVLGKAFVLENKEDMVRLANTTGNIGAAISMNDQGELAYDYYTQGYETKRYTESLYIVHTFVSEDVDSMLEEQNTRQIGIENAEKLNNRESFVPIFIAFSGALMGFFIIMSYVFLDKNEGVIKAFAVTPSAVWKYLLSKTFVILTTVIISSSIVVIPIMGLKPNYPLFYLFLMVSSFAFSSLGLLVASFFDSISKAFGVLYLIMIAMMLPGFSYYIGSFDPVWLRFFPTYPLLEGFKGIMTGSPDVGYVLGYSMVFVAGGVILLALSNIRFKKSLTV